ncbi:MAG: iron-containing alcohol dehydrogenase [Chloroflexi bacterium]|nr:iron-containing alcohol dehydrogenase [Chloroflexota bacterium]
MTQETVLETGFTMDTSSIKFGPGITRELGFEMDRLGCRRVMLVTDERVAKLPPVAIAAESLRDAGIDFAIYDRASVEPTDSSFKDAVEFAVDGGFDGYVAVGGGSSIDTAKAANLYATYPADLLEYVNAPIGKGTPVPGALKPLVAVPTTAGTGSETTGVAIFDLVEMRAKTGIAHRALRPVMGLVDPHNTESLPSMVAACSGFDVLCHGLESYTALPFHDREAPESPAYRPAYQGSNPISDVWSTRSMEMVAGNLRRAVKDPSDEEARAQMLLAASFAGVGFGNAGVHLCHGMSYPVSGNVRDYVPSGYPEGTPIVPHGMSVILNAPAVFRFTASANPERHLHAAKLLGAEVRGAGPEDAGDILANCITDLLKDLNVPNGLSAIGYSESDIDTLVQGTLPQHRVTKISPRPVDANSLASLFRDSMTLW